MATYAIGDIQGCYKELILLLDLIKYDTKQDQLWFTGDLVNRGPQSLDVLRFVKSLPDSTICTLGNHDLHLLAVGYEVAEKRKKDTFDDVLKAPDCEDLLKWLRCLPLMHHDIAKKFILVHAGIYPFWNLQEASQYANEVETVLQGKAFFDYLHHLYGNKPKTWRNNLRRFSRLRFITNAFTRMRFCDPDGKLDLTSKGTIADAPKGYLPWFQITNPALHQYRIIFGHWAALEGSCANPNIYAIDTGCVWGGSLTALRLEDQKLFSVRAKKS